MKRFLRTLTGSRFTGWTRTLYRITLLLIVLAVGGFGVAVSGVMPIKASSGHWPITEWFLHFSMERSISTHSIGIKAPPLDDPLLIVKGAGHFELGCAPCHGNPEVHHPRITAAMTPHPPYLPPQVSNWSDAELFYIVKHGIKFAGMPAWPTQQRDDEVWALTAFLRKLPELETQDYWELTTNRKEDDEPVPLHGLVEPDAVPLAIQTNCGRCHGADGLGRDRGAFPKLAGQHTEYLIQSLQAYADGERHSGIMEPISAGLGAEEIEQISRYYNARVQEAGIRQRLNDQTAEVASRAGLEPADLQAAIERGRKIAEEGIRSQKLPSCVDCHGLSGNDNEDYPLLAGQYHEYLVLQLTLFKNRHRGGTEYADLMHEVADNITKEQMRDVALFYESLPPE